MSRENNDVAAPGESDAPRDMDKIDLGPTRISVLNGSLFLGAVVLVVLLIFILENTRTVEISLFGAHRQAPLAVALLFSAAIGALLVGLVALARAAQLKRALRRKQLATDSASAPF